MLSQTFLKITYMCLFSSFLDKFNQNYIKHVVSICFTKLSQLRISYFVKSVMVTLLATTIRPLSDWFYMYVKWGRIGINNFAYFIVKLFKINLKLTKLNYIPWLVFKHVNLFVPISSLFIFTLILLIYYVRVRLWVVLFFFTSQPLKVSVYTLFTQCFFRVFASKIKISCILHFFSSFAFNVNSPAPAADSWCTYLLKPSVHSVLCTQSTESGM